MNFKNHTKIIVCFLTALWMTASINAYATNDPIVTKPIQGSLGQFVVGAESYAKDMNYFCLSAGSRNAVQNNNILNLVALGIDESSSYYIPSNFSVAVTIQITTYDKNESVTGTFDKIFNINYDTTTGSKYKNLDYASFNNAYALKAKIIKIDSGNINWPISRVLKVENQLTATRDYPFNCYLALQGLNTTFSDINNELTTTWTQPTFVENPGVTEYDLEWAWIDESALSNYMTGNNFLQDLVFTNNATRVSIKGSSYNIPLLYDDAGRIYVRVRPVQVRTDRQRVEGKWSWIYNDPNQPMESSNPVSYLFNGHESQLNWQANTSFAEEGKRKSVVQYFDGSLRNRQTVTKDNSSNTTIVAESFYDYQGRAVLQVLPAPTLNTAIAYAKNFNQAIGYDEYPKSEYDKLSGTASVCGNPAKPFNTDFGTANYYSARNPLMNNGANKFIPDATADDPNEGYAFAETRLSPDGRVAAQSGVGVAHQLGSGHETKYFYESPAQEELDALFGTDAGVASHYFKNIVQDANGQFSISYTDMHGRAVATALAGEAPKSDHGDLMLDELDSKSHQKFTKQLIDKETNIVVGNSIISSKPIVVMKDHSTYSFDYSLSPKQLTLISCSNNQPICFDCLYSLKFIIISDCDNEPLYIDSLANFSLGQFIQQCNASGNAANAFSKHFEVVLNTGSYTVTKELTLSSDAQVAFRNQFLQTDTCKRLVDFYSQELGVLKATSNCEVTCNSCKAALGDSLNGFIKKFANEMSLNVDSLSNETIIQLTAAYNEAYANCDKLCSNDGLDLIRSTREVMLQDMTPPYGQYARIDANSISKPFNIFKVADPFNYQAGYGINNFRPDYKQPRQFSNDDQNQQSSNKYFDEFQQPESTFNQILYTINSPEQFTDSFKTSWANQLLVHHPEFKLLQLSENQLKPAYQFEAHLEKDTTWDQASMPDSIYGNYSFITNLIDADPFFSGPNAVGAQYKYAMKYGQLQGSNPDTMPRVFGINRYVQPCIKSSCQNAPLCSTIWTTMWQVALGAVSCKDKIEEITPCSLSDLTDLSTIAGCTMNPAFAQPQNNFTAVCPTDKDWAWKIYKSLYLAERRKLISAYLNKNNTIISFTPGINGIPNYQRRFINHANPSSVFNNLNIANTGSVGSIISQASSNMNGAANIMHNLAEQQYDTACRSYANIWISQLKACPQINTILSDPANWQSDSTWLISRLVAICRKGADENHILGSSSVRPGNIAIVDGQVYSDFLQVVQEFLQNKGITNPTAECYSWLINTPKPYDKQVPLNNSYVLTKPSSCECHQINDLRTEWENSHFAGNFSAYLQYQHGTYISEEQLNALTALCDGNNLQCNMLEQPIPLPPVLQCPSSSPEPAQNTCISCGDYKKLRSEFYELTGQEAPFVNPKDTSQVNYNYAFANYANYQTGFTKSWQEYVAFQITCDASAPEISCGSLDSTLNAFYLTPEFISNQTGLSCIQAFVNYLNNHYGVVYTYSQWMALFSKCGNTPNVCKPKITCEIFTALVDGFYNQNGVQIYKNNNCQSLFVNYINTRLTSNYTYNQLENIYRYTCKNDCSLNVCGFPNQFLLNKVMVAFHASYPQSLNLSDCRGTFTAFFCNYFGIPFDPNSPEFNFDVIYDKFFASFIKQGCVSDISNLCNPPYTCKDLQILLEKFISKYSPIDELPNCQQAFADYFNNVLNTNYTYFQISALYQSICGEALSVCQTRLDCKTIIVFAENNPTQALNEEECHLQFLQLFNTSFGTNYTNWDELYKLYYECGFDLNTTCKESILIADCESLNIFVKDFTTNYPDPATQLGSKCQQYFAALFNQKFGTKYTYAQIETYYLQQCGTTLDVCTSSCAKLTDFIDQFNTRYSSLKLPVPAREDLFAFEYNNNFLPGGNDNAGIPIAQSAASEYLLRVEADAGAANSKDFTPLVNYPDIYNHIIECRYTDFNLYSASNITIHDPQVLLSLKQVYYIIHPKGLPDNCEADFSSWFNVVMKTKYEFKELFELYNTTCGNNAGYICVPPKDDNSEAKIFVDIIDVEMPTNLSPMLCGLNEVAASEISIEDNPCKDLPKIAYHFAQEKYDLYVDSLRDIFDSAYREKCMAAKDLESFTVTYEQSEYHYTLYYYDQAGNLVKTVPPAGVSKLNDNDIQLVKQKRQNVLNGQSETVNRLVPTHNLVTQYRYNTLGQVVAQTTPDAGLSKFYYDRLGRLVVSQNAKQKPANNYSYTLYDELGRIIEVGQQPNRTITQAISQNKVQLSSWFAAGGMKEQVTRTVYDNAYSPLQTSIAVNGGFYQKNLRNRVSYSYIKDKDVNDVNYPWNAATLYSYDIHGNVDTLLQDYGSSASLLSTNLMNTNSDGSASGSRWKRIVYNYDLISGKVNSVAYQPNQSDAFYHRYNYDAENRLILVETSSDNMLWEKDARYNYYKHGPLARVLLGELQVQGLDYAYTLQGWLKGVNSTAIGDGSFDIGNDGKVGGQNSLVARDAYGFSLNYFNGDYKQIEPSTASFTSGTFGLTNADRNVVANSLYNGNIAAMLVNIPKIGNANLYGYKYDQLNRIKSMDAFIGINNADNSFTAVSGQSYKERVTYDANGNILTYKRNGDNARLSMDEMTYTYKPNTNQLDKVVDIAPDASLIDYNKYRDIKQGQQNGNYQYDAIGNLIADVSEGITNIKWNVYGKIQEINKNGSLISYTYDASGNRISKTADGKTTWYVRDASGNVMSVYTVDAAVNSGHLTQSEVNLYGSSRLGIWNANKDIAVTPNTNYFRGNKWFELSNHLGNVLATITDKRLPHTSNNSTIDYYEADISTANDYYLGGMEMPERKYSSASQYRYGFNGKEKDSDPIQYDYGFRIYDSRLGRFLSVDPLTKSYPWYSPYQFAGNKPIIAIDLDGLEEYIVVTQHFKDGSVKSITIQYTQTKADAKVRVDSKLREVHNGSATGNYIAEGEKVLRIEQDYKGRDISKSHSNSLTPIETKIIKEYSKNETPVNKDQDIWYLKYKSKNYESDENARNTTTMTDRMAFNEFNLKSYKTINDLPAITVADGKENGNLDLNSKSNFKTELDTYLKDISNQGNVNKIEVNLNINIRGTNSGTGNMLPYIEKANSKISSQIQQYIKTKTGVDLKRIDVKINAQNGDPSKGNTTIKTQ